MPTNVAVVHAGTIERERAFGQLNKVKRRGPVQAALPIMQSVSANAADFFGPGIAPTPSFRGGGGGSW